MAPSDGRRIGTGATRTDPVWRKKWLVHQHLAKEALGGVGISARSQQEVDRIAVLVDGSVEVAPLATDPDVGLVDPDRSTMGLTELAQPLLDQRRIGEHPAVQRAVIDLDTALLRTAPRCHGS